MQFSIIKKLKTHRKHTKVVQSKKLAVTEILTNNIKTKMIEGQRNLIALPFV